ncbi:hypothetical protein [Salinigranum salinum]|uniref:hypothetical protein n=1 Tax=Salinigranum salinum TaxID=1364937 RepID=UPI001260DCB0|nr:hypothetical protein [Salinigranum salinum]
MTKEELDRFIRSQKRKTHSVDEQVLIALSMYERGLGPLHDGAKRGDLEDELRLKLDYNIGTSLSHLEEIGVVESFLPPGPTGYAISERLDDIVNGKVDEIAETDIENLIRHIQDDDPASGGDAPAVADGSGVTVRRVVANTFDLTPEGVEDYLRHGDQVKKLNKAIDAIEDSPEADKRDDYGRIVFRNTAYRYRLTEKAVELVEGE